MPSSYKVLGQQSPVMNTQTALYTVPMMTQTVASTLVICNRGESTTYRVNVRVNGEVLSDKQYIVFDAVLDANDTVFLTIGLSLNAGDIVEVFSQTSNVSFSLYGAEVT